MNNILLIDDNQDQLKELEKGLAGVLKKDEAEIRLWFPEAESGKMPQEQFEQRINDDTVLVVTDYDLTKGQTGLLGSAVVQWCQLRFIPVGNFSKGHKTALPSEPDFYEIRIPTDNGAAAYISGIYSKRLTNTPVRQEGFVLKCPDACKNRVVSAQATYPCGGSAVGGRVCEQRHAAERVLPESRLELQHAGSPSEKAALEEKA